MVRSSDMGLLSAFIMSSLSTGCACIETIMTKYLGQAKNMPKAEPTNWTSVLCKGTQKVAH